MKNIFLSYPPMHEDFIAKVDAERKGFHCECSYEERQSFKRSIERIVEVVGEEYGVNVSEIYRSRKGRGAKNVARSVAMYISQQVAGYRLSDIASAFSLAHYGGVFNAIFRLKKEMGGDGRLRKKINSIINRFDP